MDPNFTQRVTILAVTSYLSLCLILQGFIPQLAIDMGTFWILSGLFGLCSCFGLMHLVRRESEGQKKMFKSMLRDVSTDALTQVANRRTFDTNLKERIEQSQLEGTQARAAGS